MVHDVATETRKWDLTQEEQGGRPWAKYVVESGGAEETAPSFGKKHTKLRSRLGKGRGESKKKLKGTEKTISGGEDATGKRLPHGEENVTSPSGSASGESTRKCKNDCRNGREDRPAEKDVRPRALIGEVLISGGGGEKEKARRRCRNLAGRRVG